MVEVLHAGQLVRAHVGEAALAAVWEGGTRIRGGQGGREKRGEEQRRAEDKATWENQDKREKESEYRGSSYQLWEEGPDVKGRKREIKERRGEEERKEETKTEGRRDILGEEKSCD